MNAPELLRSFVNPFDAGFWLALDLVVGICFWIGVRYLALRWRNLAIAARWLLIPYVALISGGLSPRLMGLTGVDWRSSLALGVGLAAVTTGLLFLVHATVANGDRAAATPPELADSQPADLASRVNSILASGAEEWHWVFLRACLTALALAGFGAEAAAGYWAIWLAALLALPEVLLAAPNTTARLFSTIALVSTTILFLFVRNFWLCWALHASIMLFAGNVRWQEGEGRR